MYGKLAGMTGTADTEAYEFQQIYGQEVVVIPTHRSMIRDDQPDPVGPAVGEQCLACKYRQKGPLARGCIYRLVHATVRCNRIARQRAVMAKWDLLLRDANLATMCAGGAPCGHVADGAGRPHQRRVTPRRSAASSASRWASRVSGPS